MVAISIIVPSYNHARFLERRLESIFAQTERDFELILLDDASTDDSAAILERYAQRPNVQLHRSQINSGNTFKQWNRGVAMARGKYVWIAESDDEAEPRFLERLVARLDDQPSCGLAYAQSNRIDVDGRVFGSMLEWTTDVDPDRWRADYLNDGRAECANFLVLKNTIPNASAVVFRREIFEKIGGAYEKLRFRGDWMTWLRMLAVSDVAFIAEPLNRFREQHPASVRAAAIGRECAEEMIDVWRYAVESFELPAHVREALSEQLAREVFDKVRHRQLNRLAEIRAIGRRLVPAFESRLLAHARARFMDYARRRLS